MTRPSWRSPQSFTLLADVPDDIVEPLQTALWAWSDAIEARLADVRTLHSFRALLLPDPGDGASGTQLMINAVHDGRVEDFVDALVGVTHDLLAPMLSPLAGAELDPQALRTWLLMHQHDEHAVHLGVVGRTVDEILAEERLHERLVEETNARLETGAWTAGTPAETVRTALREHVMGLADPDLPHAARPPPTWSDRISIVASMAMSLVNPFSGLLWRDVVRWSTTVRPWPARVAVTLTLLPWAVYALVPAIVFRVLVRVLELGERDEVVEGPDPEALRALLDGEDLRLKNQLTMYIPVRSSGLRRWMLATVLRGAERASRHIWSSGRLADIDTIHVARFLMTHRGRRMLFLSDYDGSWDRYLEDFLTVGSRAVVPIWGQVHGCPKTRWLFGTTPGFAPRFLSLTRRYQVTTPFWYVAYPHLSVRNILDNALIRDGLFEATMSEHDARRWAARL